MKNSNQQSSFLRGKALKSMLFLGLLLLISVGKMHAGNFCQNMLQQLKEKVAETLVKEGNLSEE